MPQPDPAQPKVPAASGTLAQKPLAHLLVYAFDRKLTGSFELVDPAGCSARIVVREGKVARVATSEAVTYLGHVLYELGHIDDTTLSSSLGEVASTKKLHGQVLLERKAIDRAQLAEALRQQRSRKLQHTFAMTPASTFAFYPDVELEVARPDDVEPMDPRAAIWLGVRAHPSLEHVRAALARIEGRPLRLAPGASLEPLGLDDDERVAAECLQLKASTVPELAIVGGLTIQRTDLLAYFLLITKQVEIAERAMTSARPAASAPPAASTPPAGASRPSAPLRVSGPGGVPFASGEYKRHISFSMRAVTADEGVVRIPSPVPDRMTSSTPPRAPFPSQRVFTPTPTSRPAASAPPASVAPVSRPSGSAPAARGSMPPPADLARKKSIADRARWIDQEDYFKMLTVARDATTEDIRAAFLRSAKVWHPDTLPSSIADARPDAERVFARITTAYETLVDPEKRRAYEQSLDGTAPAKAKSEKRDDPGALHILRQAEMHMTLGERARAEDFVRRALVAQPDLSEAQAFLAYCEGLDPRFGSEDFLRGKVRAIDQVLARDPMTPRAHYYRAELCKRAGDHDEAVHDLRIAVTNDPDDVDAQRELKLYEKKLRDGVLQLRSLSPFPGLKKEKGLLDRFLKK